MPRLTDHSVERAPSRAPAYTIWGDELPRFGLRVYKSGKRSYFVEYRVAARIKRETVGSPEEWTSESARSEAYKILHQVIGNELSHNIQKQIEIGTAKQQETSWFKW